VLIKPALLEKGIVWIGKFIWWNSFLPRMQEL
jgi:hypothetical protein